MSEYKHKKCEGNVRIITIPQVDDKLRYICLKCGKWIESIEVEEIIEEIHGRKKD